MCVCVCVCLCVSVFVSGRAVGCDSKMNEVESVKWLAGEISRTCAVLNIQKFCQTLFYVACLDVEALFVLSNLPKLCR